MGIKLQSASTRDSTIAGWSERLKSLSPKCPYKPEVPIVLSQEPPVTTTLAVIGEAPGKEEEVEGKPFVGRAGQLLREILEQEGVLSETHFTNVSFWRPPRTTGAQGDERPGIAVVRSQRPRLLFELAQTRPRAVLTVGKTASEALIPGQFHRGAVESVHVGGREYPVFATYHPAYIFRAPEFYPDIVRDVQRALSLEVPREADVSYVQPMSPPEFVGKYVVLDTETTSTLPTADVVCVAARDEKATYVFTPDTFSELRTALERFPGKLVAHNAKYDEAALRRAGVPVTIHHDSLLLHLAMDTRKGSHSLKTLSPVYGQRKLAEHLVTLKEGASNVWEDTPAEALYSYNAADAVGTWDTFTELARISNTEEKRLYHFLRRAARPLTEGEYRGILVDKAALLQATEEHRMKVRQLHDEFGNLDPDSPKQVVAALRDAGYDVDSSGENILYRLTGELPKRILEYRTQAKITKSFLEPLATQWTGEDGACHPQHLLHGTSTGRTSCQNPNLQQVTPEMRGFFVARPGHQLISWDLKSNEVYCVAYLSRDEQLVHMLRQGIDPHLAVADAVGIDRQAGKTLIFSSIYGAGIRKISETLGLDTETVRRGLDVVAEMFPRLRIWRKEIIDYVNEHGYVQTPFARKISFPYQDSLTEWRVQRQACNAVPQSMGSDIGLVSLIRAYELLGLIPLAFVHDSVLTECCDEELEDKVKSLKEVLLGLFPNDLGLGWKVDLRAGPSWGNLHAA